jgi:CPA1 family monovalent cation:H+ antiporter
LAQAIFTRFMSKFIKVADANPGWKEPLISGWAGMRGVVSLAAALSVPLIVSGGRPFPYRNLILFITFIVILFTLVLQGLTLPWLIHKVKLEDKFNIMPEQQQETGIQKKLAQASLTFLQNKYGNDVIQNEHLDNLLKRLQLEINVHEQNFKNSEGPTEESLTTFRTIYLELLEEQRKLLEGMNRNTEIDEELVRKYLSLIDLEEFKIREKLI